MLRKRSLTAIGAVFLACAAFLYIVSQILTPADFREFSTMRQRVRWIQLGATALAFYGMLISVFAYLKGDAVRLEAGEFSVNKAAEPPPAQREATLPNDGPPRADTAQSDAAFSLVRDLEAAAALATPLDALQVRIGALFDANQARLRNEAAQLEKRGALNLAVGVSVTIAATGVLIYLVTRPHPDFDRLAPLLNFYIPRVTTIVLIETFAYFFLGLYRANLAEIKYYQNERTTLAALEIAWRASLQADLSEATAGVVKRLASTDRNPATLSKDAVGDKSELLEVLKSVSAIAVESLKKKAD